MRNILIFILLILWGESVAQQEAATVKKMTRTIKLIETQYVDTVNMPCLVEDAIKAMLKDLDPHSKYMTREELQKNNEALKGSFAGVGIHYQILYDTLMILSTTAGGPSEKAGLKAGDKIVSIDKVNATGKLISNSFFSRLLRGKKGSEVKITVKRRHKPQLLTFKVVRGSIPINTLDAAFMLDNTTGYIKINGFSFTTVREYEKAVKELKDKGMKNLIMDLRGNPGGLMMASIRLADEFLDKDKLIVYTEGAHYKRQEYKSTAAGNFKKGRLIVLVDEWSASASEIFAGAIQDLDRGLIAGRRSYGKGLVGRNYTLPDGSAVRLTTGHYYTPSGRCIQKSYDKGVEEYHKDMQKRLKHGELLHADSIKFPDSLKYKTLGGRTVYGGGGIMPDVFFPLDTTSFPAYYNALFKKGILNAFAGAYFDKHLDSLQKSFPDLESFAGGFMLSDEAIKQLQDFAEKYYKLQPDNKAITSTSGRIKRYFKAYLGRNLYENGAYYYLIWKHDKALTGSLKIINNKDIFKKNGIAK